jgi:hypothetical protein
MRSFWLVSPNVKNHNESVPEWKRASLRGRAAFIGYEPGRHPLGNRFANKIVPGDIILVARRHHWTPEIVCLGVVNGPARQSLKEVKTPERFGAARTLSPFLAIDKAPSNLKIIDILHHTSSLTRLHPEKDRAHALVCRWMERLLTRGRSPKTPAEIPMGAGSDGLDVIQLADSPRHHQLDYIVRSKKQVIQAKKNEARLLMNYQRWLKRSGRSLITTKHGQLQCDAFELERRNLVEAKSSTKREHIRMAVGQLLDYSCQVERRFGRTNMGILLPTKPRLSSVSWLRRLKVHLIWKDKNTFRDDANGQFA